MKPQYKSQMFFSKKNHVAVHLFTGYLFLILLSMASYSEMIVLQGGTFIAGGENGDGDELPSRIINLSGFSIDKHEVSRKEYDSCVMAGICSAPHDEDGKCLLWTSQGIRKAIVPSQYRSPELPVVCVTWHDARKYCSFKGKRLPTEAEWEYAALAGSNNRFSWGNDPPDPSRCVRSPHEKPAYPGSFQPNAWGIHDMTGNVWEWTDDRYQADLYSTIYSDNPKSPEVGRFRSIRGGGWNSAPSQLRIKNRQWFAGEYGEVSLGIRCVE